MISFLVWGIFIAIIVWIIVYIKKYNWKIGRLLIKHHYFGVSALIMFSFLSGVLIYSGDIRFQKSKPFIIKTNTMTKTYGHSLGEIESKLVQVDLDNGSKYTTPQSYNNGYSKERLSKFKDFLENKPDEYCKGYTEQTYCAHSRVLFLSHGRLESERLPFFLISSKNFNYANTWRYNVHYGLPVKSCCDLYRYHIIGEYSIITYPDSYSQMKNEGMIEDIKKVIQSL